MKNRGYIQNEVMMPSKLPYMFAITNKRGDSSSHERTTYFDKQCFTDICASPSNRM